jgi:hypothetical protein
MTLNPNASTFSFNPKASSFSFTPKVEKEEEKKEEEKKEEEEDEVVDGKKLREDPRDHLNIVFVGHVDGKL